MSLVKAWAARTALFLALFAIAVAVGTPPMLALACAAVAGWLVAYVAFPGLNAAAGEQWSRWAARRGSGDADAEAEDAEADGARRGRRT